MRAIFCILTLILLSFLGSCIEPFDPEIEEYTDSLVIEGRVVEGKYPAMVRLSRSFAFDEKEPVMVSNATVEIRDDQGGSFLLEELQDGVFQSDTNQLVGTPGHSYQLRIETAEGESYESSWVLMKKGIPIDSLRTNLEARVDNLGATIGMQIYLNSDDPENQTQFYRWEYEETWVITVPYPAYGVWSLQTRSAELYPLEEIPRVCWRTDTSSNIILSSTKGLAEDRIVDFPIHYVSDRGGRLFNKYSILVKQYSISEETFDFYTNLQSLTENLGSLFDPIPSEIPSNIRNLNRPEESIVGWFSADGFSSRRIFISRQEDLPATPILSGYEQCLLDTIPNRIDMNAFVVAGGVYVDEVYDMWGFFLGYSGTTPSCADCRTRGSIERPDFWE